jgi:polysaccharide export outer membrane protein
MVFVAALVAVSGCQTPQPEPAFQDYDPPVTSPPAQDEPTLPAAGSDEPVAAEDAAPDGMSDVFQVGDAVNVLVTGVSAEIIPPHEEGIKDDGTISLYLIGTVKAAGRSPGELQRELQKRYEVYFNNPIVTVQPSTRFYYVGGEVKRPGAQPYLGKTTVTKAIQSAGDFTDFAKKTKVQVIRADGTTLRVNFNKAIDEPSLDPPIYPGDKLHVPRRILF